ncbi:uncharacterized protein LOC130596451 [Pezoporus wallicus]|uniref:uncharacterized protein LOC130596451 n=1 Tax=Pezoporus wallicus TaxID=35540 RepID=UPI00255127BA|nr:uncharacterized protein LOC130596451 [Pezoporus wallicus]
MRGRKEKKPVPEAQRNGGVDFPLIHEITGASSQSVCHEIAVKSLSQMKCEMFTEKGSKPSRTPPLWHVLGHSCLLQTLFRDSKKLCDWLKISLGTLHADFIADRNEGSTALQVVPGIFVCATRGVNCSSALAGPDKIQISLCKLSSPHITPKFVCLAHSGRALWTMWAIHGAGLSKENDGASLQSTGDVRATRGSKGRHRLIFN